MKKPQIKIPKLYPTKTIEIEGNKIELRGYKPADKPYVIAIQQIQKQIRPIIKRIGELQSEVVEISKNKDGKALSDAELKKLGLLDRIYEITSETEDLTLEAEQINNQLIDGDSETDEMDGPSYHLAQRGLKRFYCPGVRTEELDEIEDIEVGRYYTSIIANTMISISNPPKGIERSIEARKKELEEADKGKQGKLKGRKTSQRKKN